jgi:hypothetical protein
MSLSIYQISIPAIKLALTNLSSIIDKAAAQTAAKKIDPKTVADSRLIFDMLPFKKQVQIACDIAKGGAARLAGIENPKHEDTEATLDDLKERIAKTLAFVDSITEQQLAGAESRTVELKFPSMTLTFTGLNYVTQFVLPNVYFHVTTAYAILRANGVEVGKNDYLGKIQ